MKKKVILDDGIIELDINGRGLLRFNPTDFNVYRRFLSLVEALPGLEKKYHAEIEAANAGQTEREMTASMLNKAKEMDAEIKSRLSAVFGGCDFDVLLDGTNLMAYGANGERVITNLLNALTPYMETGLKAHMKDTASRAVDEARKNREAREKQ